MLGGCSLPVETRSKPSQKRFSSPANSSVRLQITMNLAEKPETVFAIYQFVLRVGLGITAVYAIRQVILVLLILCNCKRRIIEVPEIEDHSLREEHGRMETNYLNFTAVDHLFDFDKADLKKPKRTREAPRAPRARPGRRRFGDDARRSVTVKIRDKEKRIKEKMAKKHPEIESAVSTPSFSPGEFQRSMVDEIEEYSIESSPVNESSLLALSDSERSAESFKVTSKKKIKKSLRL